VSMRVRLRKVLLKFNMSKQGYEQHKSQEAFLDRMQAASLGVPEGEVRDQFTRFVVQVSVLFEKYGVQSEEEFLGVKWDEEKYPDLARYSMLIDKLNEILDTMELVVDDSEYRLEKEKIGEVSSVEIVQGVPYVFAKQGEETVVFNFLGEEIFRSQKRVEFVNKEAYPFLMECEANEFEHTKEQKRTLYSLAGEHVFTSTTEIEFALPGGKIKFLNKEGHNTFRPYDAKGNDVLKNGEHPQPSRFEVGEEFFCEVQDAQYHKSHIIDKDGEKIGPSYDFNEILPSNASGDYVVGFGHRFANGKSHAYQLLHKDGSVIDVPAPESPGMISISGEIIRVDRYDDEGQLEIVDEHGGVKFGANKHDHFRILDINRRVGVESGLRFICRVEKKGGGIGVVLLNEDGELAASIGSVDDVYETMEHIETIEGIAFFLMYSDGGNEQMIISSKGEICVGPASKVGVLNTSERKFYFFERDDSGRWVVVCHPSRTVATRNSFKPLEVISHNGEELIVWEDAMGLPSQKISKADGPYLLESKGWNMRTYYDSLGRPYFIGEGVGSDAVINWKGNNETGRRFAFHENVVPMKDKILFLVSEDERDEHRYILDNKGKWYDVSEEVLMFDKHDDNHIIVVYKEGDSVVKKIVRV
jgi:hypothetical protein